MSSATYSLLAERVAFRQQQQRRIVVEGQFRNLAGVLRLSSIARPTRRSLERIGWIIAIRLVDSPLLLYDQAYD
ncbi:hypothetical protein ACS5NO_16940 [Larkinella sp. GY13]|uniref:hypothetical protein n=1 Tax=Larkinella sp. GY13 TaxID=3453720 RepID=UPI003EEFFF14